MSASADDRLAHGLALVRSKIVHDDNVSRRKCRHEKLFDIGKEAGAVDRTIKYAGGVDPVDTQGGKERQRAPTPVRDAIDQAFTARSPTSQRRHIRFRPCLIDEDQARGINARLIFDPPCSSAGYVRPVLFCRDHGFFYG